MRFSPSKIKVLLWQVSKSRLFLNFLVLLFLLTIVNGTGASKARSTIMNLPDVSEQLVSVDEPLEVVEEVDEIVGNVVAKPVSVEPDVKGETESKSETQVQTQTVDVAKSKKLCDGVREQWKMIADPDHAGQYVICNTSKEIMTTVSELNAAQNSYRQKHGLNALNINSELCSIAASRAAQISKNFSHDGFKAAVDATSLDKNSFGENIASGPLSGVHFVEWSWDKSPGHRENMLGDWTDGCGGVYDKYAVFLFAK